MPQQIRFFRLLQPDDFELVTTYENFGCCKPNLKYFEEICKKQDIKPEDSIMIGNDVDEDLCSAKLGFDTYLITDTIVNRDNKDYSDYKNGRFSQRRLNMIILCGQTAFCFV